MLECHWWWLLQDRSCPLRWCLSSWLGLQNALFPHFSSGTIPSAPCTGTDCSLLPNATEVVKINAGKPQFFQKLSQQRWRGSRKSSITQTTALVFLLLLPAPRWVLLQSHLSFLQAATEDAPSPRIRGSGTEKVPTHTPLSLQASLVWCWKFPAAFLAHSSYLNQWLPNEGTNGQGVLYSAALWYSKFSFTCRIIIFPHLMRTVLHSQSVINLCA